jgi:Cytochrome c554 and c-prime
MKKYLLGFAVLALVTSCQKEKTDPHVAGALCGSCHTTEQSQWASSNDLHALSTADVLTNVDHNTAELLNDDCLKCHSTFQFMLGVSNWCPGRNLDSTERN